MGILKRLVMLFFLQLRYLEETSEALKLNNEEQAKKVEGYMEKLKEVCTCT